MASSSYTYVFYNPGTGLTKIGRSINPLSRMGQLYGPSGLEFVAAWADEREHAMFARFAQERSHGEWFELEEDQLAVLARESEFPSVPHPHYERERKRQQQQH